jgi:hypothetical protein
LARDGPGKLLGHADEGVQEDVDRLERAFVGLKKRLIQRGINVVFRLHRKRIANGRAEAV